MYEEAEEVITHFDCKDVPRQQCSRAGRTFYDYLNTHTRTHTHTHSPTHTHILLQLRGKAKDEAKAKANSCQVKQLLFKLDGVDFGNNNNKNINKYLCVCV